MKRVNTGAKTKSDPDSRINKALRKWNCKCGSDKNAFVTGFMDEAATNAAPLVGGLTGGALGALGGGALGGLHGAISPGEYTDEAGRKKKRGRGMGALRGLLAGVGLGGVGGAVGGAVGLPMLTKSKPQADMSKWIPGYDNKNTLSSIEERIRKSLEDGGPGPEDWMPEKQNAAYNLGKTAQNPEPFHTGKFDWLGDPLKPDTSPMGRLSTWLTGNPAMRLDWDKIMKQQQSKAMSVSPSRASFFMQGKPEGFTRLVMPKKSSAAVNFAKTAAKRVLNLSPSWGGGKYQLGEMFLNPQVGYRYLGGVVPTPDVGLRLGGFLGGNTIGLAPLPYIETDWGRPSGWQANKETRSLYKWLGDAGRDRSTAAMHAITNLPEDAGPDDYERVMRNNAIGYSSKELKRLAERMAKIGPVALPE